MNNSKLGISRDFAYFLKQEHLYSNYRAYLKRNKTSYDEYKFWANVSEKFYIFLVAKYECEKDVILN